MFSRFSTWGLQKQINLIPDHFFPNYNNACLENDATTREYAIQQLNNEYLGWRRTNIAHTDDRGLQNNADASRLPHADSLVGGRSSWPCSHMQSLHLTWLAML